jgi:hypothetical protein
MHNPTTIANADYGELNDNYVYGHDVDQPAYRRLSKNHDPA